MRKEEEKSRRELIKQEYLRKKQQELLEEQGMTKPRPRNRRARPKSQHRAESSCSARKKALLLMCHISDLTCLNLFMYTCYI